MWPGARFARICSRLLARVLSPVLVVSLANRVPITEIMSRRTHDAPADATVDTLRALMIDHHIGCIPILGHDKRPVGIVTKLDLVECRDESRKTARDIMMPHAMTLGPDATVARAASLMTDESIHHILVVDAGGGLLGVVSTMDITRWVARSSEGTE